MRIPAQPPDSAITALIDTREQTPLVLPGIRAKPPTLATGDYSVSGLESVVAIERKSLPDLPSCCGRERERFDREATCLSRSGTGHRTGWVGHRNGAAS
jgi:ERCC4-type nuclease